MLKEAIMNEFRRLKLGTDFDNAMIASASGVDIAVVNLFELQTGFIDYNTAVTICNVLDCTFFDMFPGLQHLVPAPTEEADEEDQDEFSLEIFEDASNRPLLLQHGLDPDIRPWFAHVHMKSGNDRRYRLSSLECDRLQETLTTAETNEGYLVFFADCQTVIIKRSSLSNIRFTNSLSYAPFSSEERGLAMTLVSSSFARPIETGVLPDSPADEGGHGQPLLGLIEKARNNLPLQPFIRLPEDEDVRFTNIEEFEIIEIPIGLTVPGFYDDEEEVDTTETIDLETIEAAGTA
jgi:hypothetical protein